MTPYAEFFDSCVGSKRVSTAVGAYESTDAFKEETGRRVIKKFSFFRFFFLILSLFFTVSAIYLYISPLQVAFTFDFPLHRIFPSSSAAPSPPPSLPSLLPPSALLNRGDLGALG